MAGYDQQDAHEFLVTFLDGLHTHTRVNGRSIHTIYYLYVHVFIYIYIYIYMYTYMSMYISKEFSITPTIIY